MRRFVFHHRQHVVGVVVVEYSITIGILPHISVIQSSRADFACTEICVHFGFITTSDLFGIPVMSFGFYTQLPEGIGHLSKLKKSLTGFGVGCALMNKYIQKVVAAATAPKTAEVERLSIVDKGSMILLMEWTATLHIPLVEVGDPQLFNNDLCVFVSELFFGLHDCVSINLHG